MAETTIVILTAIAVLLPVLVIIYFAKGARDRPKGRERSGDGGAHGASATASDSSRASARHDGWDSSDSGGDGGGGGGD